MLETLPRIAPFIEFLAETNDIKIHGIETTGRLAELLHILGIRQSRLVSGVVGANIAYAPPASGCHQPLTRIRLS